MASLAEMTAGSSRFLVSPRRGPGVCQRCFNLTDGWERCYACIGVEPHLEAVLPVSYSVAHEELHIALANYKRLLGLPADRATRRLAAILSRFLALHEGCIAAAAGVSAFDVVTTVPSNDLQRDESHPLRTIVGELVRATSTRHERLLRRTVVEIPPRAFDRRRYEAVRSLQGASVLLVDDTWTTGANAQSAAAALRAAGAGPVAAVVIGRHVNRDWHDNDRRLRTISQAFEWSNCALCAETRKAELAA